MLRKFYKTGYNKIYCESNRTFPHSVPVHAWGLQAAFQPLGKLQNPSAETYELAGLWL